MPGSSEQPGILPDRHRTMDLRLFIQQIMLQVIAYFISRITTSVQFSGCSHGYALQAFQSGCAYMGKITPMVSFRICFWYPRQYHLHVHNFQARPTTDSVMPIISCPLWQNLQIQRLNTQSITSSSRLSPLLLRLRMPLTTVPTILLINPFSPSDLYHTCNNTPFGSISQRASNQWVFYCSVP